MVSIDVLNHVGDEIAILRNLVNSYLYKDTCYVTCVNPMSLRSCSGFGTSSG